MPVRWLIGPGLLLVGVGLLLMTGLDGASTWTHLIPGFIVAGAGAGMVNPPLASTAVGVVSPQRSGMASGVNTTFRQIGIATGIAAYGSIFAASLQSKLGQALAGSPQLHAELPRIVGAVQQGNAGQVIGAVPDSQCRGPLVAAIHSSFASTLDILLFVSAVLALVGAVCAVTLIRSRDFVVSHAPADADLRRAGERHQRDEEPRRRGRAAVARVPGTTESRARVNQMRWRCSLSVRKRATQSLERSSA